jgi:hypothetical protein
MGLQEVLEKHGHDSECTLLRFDASGLDLEIRVASHAGEKWILSSSRVVWADLAPSFTMEAARFGGLEILSGEYLRARNVDAGGATKDYRVIQFRDIDGKSHSLILFGPEEFKK